MRYYWAYFTPNGKPEYQIIEFGVVATLPDKVQALGTGTLEECKTLIREHRVSQLIDALPR